MRSAKTIAALLCFVIALSAQGVYAEYPEILWWYDVDAPSFGSGAAADIDGDSILEIVFGTYFNDERIHALNAESGDSLWTFFTDGCNDASSAIADVDLDGELEVIAPASSPSMVYCFNGTTGDIEWSTPTGYDHCIDSPPAVADVDNDGKPEVILGTFLGNVFCLNGEDGSECWQINLGTNSYIQSGPNILDLDGDDDLDVVVAQYAGDCKIFGLEGHTGDTLWSCDAPTDYMYHGGSFADIDEDSLMEIAIGSYEGKLFVINAEDGSVEWTYPTAWYIGAPTSIADLDNDGHLEVVVVSYNKVSVLSHTGSHQWSYSAGGGIFRGVSIADINGDDTLDVVFGADDGILRVLTGSHGSTVWTLDLEAHYGRTFEIDNAPVIEDFDGDGKLDIFIVGGYGTSSAPENNHGRAYAIAAGDGTGPGWPMFRHDLYHTARFSVEEEEEYVCGDADGSGSVDIDDAVYLINYIFAEGPPPEPFASGDADCSGEVDIDDVVYLIGYIFSGGFDPCDPDGDTIPDC